MNDQITRYFKILNIIPEYPRTITTLAIQRRLEDEFRIRVSIRTIQRDMDLFRDILPEIYCDETENEYSWSLRKSKKSQARVVSPLKELRLVEKYDFRKICDDVTWYLTPDTIFDAIKQKHHNFSHSNIFDGFTVIPLGKSSVEDDKIIVFIFDNESASQEIEKAIKYIKAEKLNIKSIMFYLDIIKDQWDSIQNQSKFVSELSIHYHVEIRFRGTLDNGRELFIDNFQVDYYEFEKELLNRMLSDLRGGADEYDVDHFIDLLDDFWSPEVEASFEKHNEILLTDFNHRWFSFLLTMAKKKLSGVIIENDMIGFDLDESSNNPEFYSLTYDITWVMLEIHDRLDTYYGVYTYIT